MTNTAQATAPQAGSLPRRWKPPNLIGFLIVFALVFFLMRGTQAADISWDTVTEAGPRLWDFLQRAIPPDWPIIPRMFEAMLLTLASIHR